MKDFVGTFLLNALKYERVKFNGEICKIQAMEKDLAAKLDSKIDVKPFLPMTMIYIFFYQLS